MKESHGDAGPINVHWNLINQNVLNQNQLPSFVKFSEIFVFVRFSTEGKLTYYIIFVIITIITP